MFKSSPVKSIACIGSSLVRIAETRDPVNRVARMIRESDYGPLYVGAVYNTDHIIKGPVDMRVIQDYLVKSATR